jgi:tetratricopeptide (TPR) repeat protein
VLAAGLLLAGALAVVISRRWPDQTTVTSLGDPPRVIAVGRIAHYAQGGHGTLGPPLADMLATNLARVGSLRVISHVRMVEVTRQLGLAGDSMAVAAAARKAGATELLDGALYEVGGGVLRLDLRRVDLSNGSVLQAYTCQGADLFALADSSTGELVRDLGVSAPAGSLADVSTRSVSAYRAYEEGLRRFYSGDVPAAEQLFAEALRADSNFAMAAYYHAISENAGDRHELFRRFRRAVALAERASDRERLLILAAWAFYNSSPRTGAYADTLIVRYPAEVVGYYYRGQTALSAGELRGAREALTEVVMRDSLGFRVESERCLACDALRAIGYSYALADSQLVAARFARRWADRQPFSAAAWRNLAVAWAFAGPGFADSAEAAWRTADSLAPGSAANRMTRAYVHFRAERYAEAERIYRAELEAEVRNERLEARWQLANLLRHLGRYREALEHAREYRRMLLLQTRVERAQYAGLLEAQILRERGNARAAAALFDSVAHDTPPDVDVAYIARNRVWAWVHMSDALASLGDTARLPRLADSMRVLGQESGLLRDRKLHYHVRGLLALRRGDAAEASRLFRMAITSPSHGYTRTNYELASALMTLNRPAEAVATLQAALRGAVDGGNLYITRTLLHERLAEAWEAAGGRDSAATHYELVVRQWERGDPALVARRERARAGIARLRPAP